MKILSLPIAALALSMLVACEPAPKPGQVCWKGNEPWPIGAEYCAGQACFPKTNTFDIDETSGTGFVCAADSSCQPPADPRYTTLITYELATNDGNTVTLTFDAQLLANGFTLDNMRTYLDSAAFYFGLPADTGYVADVSVSYSPGVHDGTPEATVELTSYDNGILGLHLVGVVESAYYVRDTPAYFCNPADLTQTCTRRDCHYYSADAGGENEPADVDLTVHAPIGA